MSHTKMLFCITLGNIFACNAMEPSRLTGAQTAPTEPLEVKTKEGQITKLSAADIASLGEGNLFTRCAASLGFADDGKPELNLIGYNALQNLLQIGRFGNDDEVKNYLRTKSGPDILDLLYACTFLGCFQNSSKSTLISITALAHLTIRLGNEETPEEKKHTELLLRFIKNTPLAQNKPENLLDHQYTKNITNRGPWHQTITLPVDMMIYTNMSFSTNNKTITARHRLSSLGTWYTADSQPAHKLIDLDRVIICASPNNQLLITRAGSQYELYNTITGARKPLSQPHRAYEEFLFIFSPDNASLAVSKINYHNGKRICRTTIWDTREGIQKYVLFNAATGNGIYALAFSPDSKTIATSFDGKTITLWDTATGTEKSKITLANLPPSSLIVSLNFSPDHNKLCASYTIQPRMDLPGESLACSFAPVLINLATGEQKELAPQNSSGLFSPTGKTIAFQNCDKKSVVIFDTTTGNPKVEVGLTGALSKWHAKTMVYNQAGSAIAIVSSDNSVRILDIEAGMQTAILRGHTRKINDIVFSPDGSLLASSADDETIRLWTPALSLEQCHLEDMQKLLCLKLVGSTTFGRKLTPAECKNLRRDYYNLPDAVRAIVKKLAPEIERPARADSDTPAAKRRRFNSDPEE